MKETCFSTALCPVLKNLSLFIHLQLKLKDSLIEFLESQTYFCLMDNINHDSCLYSAACAMQSQGSEDSMGPRAL